jgi:hypothetical protein
MRRTLLLALCALLAVGGICAAQEAIDAIEAKLDILDGYF